MSDPVDEFIVRESASRIIGLFHDVEIKCPTSPIKFRLCWVPRSSTFLLTFAFPATPYTAIREVPTLDEIGDEPTISWAPTHQESRLVIALLSLVEDVNSQPLKLRIILSEVLTKMSSPKGQVVNFNKCWIPLDWMGFGLITRVVTSIYRTVFPFIGWKPTIPLIVER